MIFAPLLILTGIAGFVLPAQYSLMSNATRYNLFHIIFGAIGLVLLQTKNDLAASAFNLGFALASIGGYGIRQWKETAVSQNI